MKQLLLALAVTFAFGTAFAQSTPPAAAGAPAATTAASTPVAADAPAAEDDDDQAAAVPQGAEEVFTAPGGAAEVPTVAVPKVTPNISHTMMGVGAAALVAVALSAGGGGGDDDKPDDGCRSHDNDCPSSP